MSYGRRTVEQLGFEGIPQTRAMSAAHLSIRSAIEHGLSKENK